MKTLTIGDIHGRDIWKQILFGNGYEFWRQDQNTNDLAAYDKIIFIGDYVDSFDVPAIVQLHNLNEIIHLKKSFPDKIVLLLGNHDTQYIDSSRGLYTGSQVHMLFDFNRVFTENQTLFQAAFQYKNYLWTHAGITKGFDIYCLKNVLSQLQKTKYKVFIEDLSNDVHRVGELLNFLYDINHDNLYLIPKSRGGTSNYGGIFWADKTETWKKPIPGLHQIVGHTATNEIQQNIFKKKDASITYVDVLNNESLPLDQKYYELEIQ